MPTFNFNRPHLIVWGIWIWLKFWKFILSTDKRNISPELNRPLLWFQGTQPVSLLSANLHKHLTLLLHPNITYVVSVKCELTIYVLCIRQVWANDLRTHTRTYYSVWPAERELYVGRVLERFTKNRVEKRLRVYLKETLTIQDSLA